MYKLALTQEQQGCFLEFLESETKDFPTNVKEWGDEFLLVQDLNRRISDHLKEDCLSLYVHQYYPVFNFLAVYIHSIKDEQKGEDTFNHLKEVFINLHKLAKSRYSPYVFIPEYYELVPVILIYVNPLSDPAQYIPEHLKTNQI